MQLSSARKLAAGALAVVALLAVPSAAAPAEQIVVYGAASGSNLTIRARGGQILVKGSMAHQPPLGCHFTRGHSHAVCSLAHAAAMEVQMGPSNDFVRVADRLPFPLTVHLGDGSDRFVGSGERDTCYSEGSARNRCIGGGGNDTCITGPRNSDCVGGPGDDYCQHEGGSDGCWGGPGDDVCLMGGGQDGCHGERGNDRLYGGPSADQLYGGPGYDYCDGGPGWGKSHECDAGPRR